MHSLIKLTFHHLSHLFYILDITVRTNIVLQIFDAHQLSPIEICSIHHIIANLLLLLEVGVAASSTVVFPLLLFFADVAASFTCTFSCSFPACSSFSSSFSSGFPLLLLLLGVGDRKSVV